MNNLKEGTECHLGNIKEILEFFDIPNWHHLRCDLYSWYGSTIYDAALRVGKYHRYTSYGVEITITCSDEEISYEIYPEGSIEENFIFKKLNKDYIVLYWRNLYDVNSIEIRIYKPSI